MNTRLLTKISVLSLAVVVSAGMVGCKKKPHATPGPGPGLEGAGGPIAVAPAPDTTGIMPPRSGDPTQRNQPPRLAANTVHFAFDSSVVNPSERPKLDDMAGYMRENPNQIITIEGHCDERGTAEYNRALGERRAQACREYLAGAGVDGNKLQTISYGKEKPADLGHGEEAWAKNRRAEFIITGQ
jgi:peptidoglycan-associated lipoprotein